MHYSFYKGARENTHYGPSYIHTVLSATTTGNSSIASQLWQLSPHIHKYSWNSKVDRGIYKQTP